MACHSISMGPSDSQDLLQWSVAIEYWEYLCESFSAPRTLLEAGPSQENTKGSFHHLAVDVDVDVLLVAPRP